MNYNTTDSVGTNSLKNRLRELADSYLEQLNTISSEVAIIRNSPLDKVISLQNKLSNYKTEFSTCDYFNTSTYTRPSLGVNNLFVNITNEFERLNEKITLVKYCKIFNLPIDEYLEECDTDESYMVEVVKLKALSWREVAIMDTWSYDILNLLPLPLHELTHLNITHGVDVPNLPTYASNLLNAITCMLAINGDTQYLYLNLDYNQLQEVYLEYFKVCYESFQYKYLFHLVRNLQDIEELCEVMLQFNLYQ